MQKPVNLKTVIVICFTALCFFSVNLISENIASAANPISSQKKMKKKMQEEKKLQVSQPADFVWKYTYGRGAGTATFLACRKGRDQVGGLCYDTCKSGYSVNKDNKLRCKPPGDASYGRGAGEAKILACGQGRDKVGALCYDKCKSGYSVNENNKLRCKPPGDPSYGRGAGRSPHPKHGCRSREKQAGLCYTRCREGYRGEGMVCWRTAKGYDRKPHEGKLLCAGGKVEQDGLCYDSCRDGYNGRGPVCYRKAKGYDREPFEMKSTCERSKEMHQSLCYNHCRLGTKGIGPVCWAKKTKGYVDCGSGFATGFKVPFAEKGVSPKTNCAIITAGQVLAAADFAAYICTLAGNPGCGVVGQMDKIKIAEEYVGMEDEVLTYGQLTYNKMLPYAKRIARMISKDPDALAAAANQRKLIEEAGSLDEIWKALSTFQKIKLAKTSAKATSKTYNIFSKMTFSGDLNTQAGQLAIVRDAAALSSAFIVIGQLTGRLPQTLELDGALSAFGILSSYAYPISTKM